MGPGCLVPLKAETVRGLPLLFGKLVCPLESYPPWSGPVQGTERTSACQRGHRNADGIDRTETTAFKTKTPKTMAQRFSSAGPPHAVKSFAEEYRMVLCDECHHAAAFMFGKILREVKT